MSEKLRIELTRAERKKSGCVTAYEFSATSDGIFIRECWRDHDEIYSDGITASVPSRVWAEAMPWLVERTLPTPLTSGGTE